MTRWVDDHGSNRNDIRVGAVHRFSLSEESAMSDVVGVSAFVQQSREFQHTRLVTGADYAGKWGPGSLNLFVPTTGWVPSHAGYEERALAGIELGLGFDLTTTLSMRTAIGQWEDDDGLGGWSTNGRMAVGWRPHPWLDIGVAWNGLGTDSDAQVLRLAFSMPLGEMRRPPEWEGLGLVAGGPKASAIDPWSPIENIDVIQVARREITADQLVSEASVRFLQDSAVSGGQIGLEVSLPAVTPSRLLTNYSDTAYDSPPFSIRFSFVPSTPPEQVSNIGVFQQPASDLNVVVTLAPGSGENPAVPGVDYVDEPIPVTIYAGTSSSVVTVQLPLNSDLDESRSLSATVTLAS